jgi:hypothetical protein
MVVVMVMSRRHEGRQRLKRIEIPGVRRVLKTVGELVQEGRLRRIGLLLGPIPELRRSICTYLFELRRVRGLKVLQILKQLPRLSAAGVRNGSPELLKNCHYF